MSSNEPCLCLVVFLHFREYVFLEHVFLSPHVFINKFNSVIFFFMKVNNKIDKTYLEFL